MAAYARLCCRAVYDERIVALAYSFVLEELQSFLSPDRLRVRPMFGCHALYVDEKIVFILRRKGNPETVRDDGMWVALAGPEQSNSLAKDFPALREIEIFKGQGRQGFASWLNLPENEDGFEEAALEMCRLVSKRDSRIGKVPKPRKKRAASR